jgi:hypothetical protein
MAAESRHIRKIFYHRPSMMFQMGPIRSINPASSPAAVLTGNPFHSGGSGGGHQHLHTLGRRERAGDRDYWAGTMQDDCYLIAAEGWKVGAQPREIQQVKNKENKLVWPELHDFKKGKHRFKSA